MSLRTFVAARVSEREERKQDLLPSSATCASVPFQSRQQNSRNKYSSQWSLRASFVVLCVPLTRQKIETTFVAIATESSRLSNEPFYRRETKNK